MARRRRSWSEGLSAAVHAAGGGLAAGLDRALRSGATGHRAGGGACRLDVGGAYSDADRLAARAWP